jgi:hypothetical protein
MAGLLGKLLAAAKGAAQKVVAGFSLVGKAFGQGVPPELGSIVASSDPSTQFIREGKWFHVNSSNVLRIMYDREEEKLWVHYKSGAPYWYYPVQEVDALDMFIAGSKGIWVWDNLRVRGSRTAHKKAYGQ